LAKVITLDGLATGSLGSRHRECVDPVKAYSPTLGYEVTFCGEDFEKPASGRKKRGRRKGSTVKNGARSPRVKKCTKTRVQVSKGRKICRCVDGNNRRILPHKVCGLSKRS
jgi:hypothetical protein